ncbi:hypothetical protein [Sphingobium sp. B11D3A]|uniref:hypothetical protein n=1 Tax=Sphingobium sp. B11D3A TaxID=2940574 RepID=UPI00222468B6|nr:hypothetical protein [Sphingobium sp. B11D3A]MCW2390971.1 hypothetical protein [Sphingobium sp. B11D3A]
MDQTIRPANSVMLFKLETNEGVDPGPTAANAFPFEADGFSYNTPFTEEQSNEATGSLVSGAPLIVGQPAEVTIRFRMKGAAAAYTASVKPPHHDLLASCGLRGVFQAAIAAAALTAGSATSATLGTGFATTAQLYRGMPLVLSGGPGDGRTTLIADYTSGKVATLVDTFDTPLTTTTQAAIPPNWTYAGTSPADAAARLTDHPSGTLYLYEDGVLLKFVGCRGIVQEWGGDTAKPGFITVKLMGVFAGRTDAAVPVVSVAAHAAPMLVQGVNQPNPAFLMNRKGLPIDRWSINLQAEQESPGDPNTNYGFGPSILGKRAGRLECDPKATLVATRDILAEVQNSAVYNGVIRAMGSANNRWAITLPQLTPVGAQPGTSGSLRTFQERRAMTTPGKDSNGRDGDFILCFW